eukprot:529171-Amphidinium_carterae.1
MPPTHISAPATGPSLDYWKGPVAPYIPPPPPATVPQIRTPTPPPPSRPSVTPYVNAPWNQSQLDTDN